MQTAPKHCQTERKKRMIQTGETTKVDSGERFLLSASKHGSLQNSHSLVPISENHDISRSPIRIDETIT